MSHRRPDPSQAMLEQTLRRALRLAADSIEPAGDGLQRIRGKIAAGPPPSLGAAGWRARYMSGLLAMLMTAAWFLEPIGKRIWFAFAEVAERFRPDADDTRKLKWLRPAASLTAAFLVVAGLSFAVTSVPPAIIQSMSNSNSPVAGGTSTAGAPSSGSSGTTMGGGGPFGRSGSASPQGSTSCKAGASASATASPSPSPSPGSSSAGSPSPSGTPSPTSTPTDTASSSPTDSPSPTGSATGQATQPPDSPPASAGAIPRPGNATPKSSPAHPTASGSKNPCRA